MTMAIDAERRKVLEMIESGSVSAEEGLRLLDVLIDLGDEDESEPETNEPLPSASPDSAPSEKVHKWKGLWQVPLWLGITLVVLSAIAMFLAIRSTGYGIWFILAWLPLLSGIFWIVFAWECRTAHWLYLHIRQKAGAKHGNFTLGFPLPLRFSGWLLRIFGDKISPKQNKSITQIIQALETQTSFENPIYIDIDGCEDGKRVQLVLG